MSPGRLFLDKIVQINFHIPEVTDRSLKEMAVAIMSSKKGGLELQQTKNMVIDSLRSLSPDLPAQPWDKATKPNTVLKSTDKNPIQAVLDDSKQRLYKALKSDLIDKPDIASYDSDDIREAILTGSGFLKNNPRQFKRFINQFRLMVYICHEKELFREQIITNIKEGLNLERLAIWVAWTIRWPDLVKNLIDGIWREEIRDYLHSISDMINDNGQWRTLEDWPGLKTELDKGRLNLNRTESPSHWRFLPWEQWLGEKAFREGIRLLGCFWRIPEEKTFVGNGQQDMLEVMLTMTSSFQTPTTNISPDLIIPILNKSDDS